MFVFRLSSTLDYVAAPRHINPLFVRPRWGEKGTQGCVGLWMLGLIAIGLHLLALES